MGVKQMKILQVSTADIAGGAESVAWRLFEAYRRLGYSSWLAVGVKRTTDHDVLLIPNNKFRTSWWTLFRRWIRRGLGHEDFDFPGTWHILDLPPRRPDILHCHNLHGPIAPGGGYFDLQALPQLSQHVPTVLTLHDCWLLTGHCAHPFNCERWKTGCGQCPDLSIYPAIRRDATAYNWQRKRNIYAKSRLYVVTPSKWLMQKVKQSILAPAILEARVIPNGVDLSIFRPADKQAVRAALGLPQDARILLFSANGIRRNIWKDYQTLRTAVALVADELKMSNILFIALGEDAPPEQIGQAVAQFVPYQKDPVMVARYYQTADLYIHAARADTFPNTVLEALACGTPVVATAVGGIPEQVKGLRLTPVTGKPIAPEFNAYTPEEATGILVRQGDAIAMAEAIITLLKDKELRQRLGENAARDARERFDLDRQVEVYLSWYKDLVLQRLTSES